MGKRGPKPSKTLDEKKEITAKICAEINCGMTLEQSLILCEIKQRDFYHWMEASEDIRSLIARAREEYRKKLVGIIEANPKSAGGPAWLLERLQPYRDDFRPPVSRQELSGPNGAPLQIQALPIRGIDREEMERARQIGAKLQAKALPKPS